MNLKTIKTYKGGLDRIKSNGTFSQETVEKATINFNKMVEDFALDNLFEEGISSTRPHSHLLTAFFCTPNFFPNSV